MMIINCKPIERVIACIDDVAIFFGVCWSELWNFIRFHEIYSCAHPLVLTFKALKIRLNWCFRCRFLYFESPILAPPQSDFFWGAVGSNYICICIECVTGICNSFMGRTAARMRKKFIIYLEKVNRIGKRLLLNGKMRKKMCSIFSCFLLQTWRICDFSTVFCYIITHIFHSNSAIIGWSVDWSVFGPNFGVQRDRFYFWSLFRLSMSNLNTFHSTAQLPHRNAVMAYRGRIALRCRMNQHIFAVAAIINC